jgi:hypothetical protein
MLATILIRMSILLLAATMWAPMSEALADATVTAPVPTLIIDYYTRPENRPALKNYMRKTGLERFEAMRRRGDIVDYRIFFSRYVDSDSWDMMAIVSFSTDTELSNWRRIEESYPAGLCPSILRLTASIHSTPADLIRSEESLPQTRTPKAVYLVIPYSFQLSEVEYKKYFDTYVAPEIDGWIKTGVVDRYGMYIARYGAGRPWRSMIIYQYNGDEGLSRRTEAIAAVRAELRKNPEWKDASDNKRSIRTELRAVVADGLTMR